MVKLRHLEGKPATMAQIMRHAKAIAYLGKVDAIRAALANEYGSDRKLPSAVTIQQFIDARRGGRG